MSDEHDTPGEARRATPDRSENGIFGKLPDARPGTRSPRRRAAGTSEKKPQAGRKTAARTKPPAPRKQPAKAKPKAAAAPKPQPAADAAKVAAASKPTERPRPATKPSGPGEERSAGLEDIAWAGVAAAAEAATLGVRIANKAIEAFRGTSERR